MDAWRCLRIDDSSPDGQSTWNVRGEIDFHTADLFRRRLRMATQRPGPIVLDMSGVSFMDTSGVRELLRVCSAGHDVVIRRPSRSVELILGLSQISGRVTVEAASRRDG